jgi:hypothetical protein
MTALIFVELPENLRYYVRRIRETRNHMSIEMCRREIVWRETLDRIQFFNTGSSSALL